MTRLLRRLSTLLVAGLLPAFSALAQDARELSTPTGHLYYYGADAATLNGAIGNGFRITDLEVESTSPLRFTATLVHNSGPYASGWWWYYGLTANQLAANLAANQARLIDLEPYEVNGSTRFACVMVPNTGSQQKAWWYYYGASVATISAAVSNHGARIVDLDRYEIGNSTLYSAVMIRNSGADARAWWWYVNASEATINGNVQQNGSRVYDIERRSNGNFDAVLVRDLQPRPAWTWWFGLTAQGVADKLGNYGHRPVDLETYFVNGQRRFAMATINNSNALTTAVGNLMRGTTDGTVGAFLKEINGGVQAWLNGDRRFEPASTMKTLHHVHAMRRVRLGAVGLLTPITVFTAMNGSCPVDNNPVQQPLTDVLRAMMEQSDNARTQAIAAFFGVNNINATAQALGMVDTSLNHRIGCGGPAIANPNRITLQDLSRLHEQVAGGYLGGYRDVFYEHMLNGLGWGGIGSIIDQEAATFGLSAAKIAAFKAQTDLAQKGGSYTLIYNNQTHEHRAGFGWIRVPFLNNGFLSPREFAVGAFVNDATDGNNASSAVRQAVGELMRPTLRAALATWARYPLLGSAVPVGRGCGGRVPHRHTAAGVPTLGGSMGLESRDAAPGSFAVMVLGFSDQLWNGVQLPAPVIPGTTCMAYNDLAVTASTISDATGFASIPLGIPNDNSFLAATLFTQFYAFSSSGLTTSNGMRLVVGQ